MWSSQSSARFLVSIVVLTTIVAVTVAVILLRLLGHSATLALISFLNSIPFSVLVCLFLPMGI